MEEILEILTGLHNNVDFRTHQTLIDDAILDSFDIISIVASLSDQFDITVPPEEIAPENFNSAGALWDMVRRLMEE
jgi:acyl carrier protein